MSDPPTAADRPATLGSRAADYVVVARRYRPQQFDELVGQEHVAQALSNAIRTNRVGHAYLFTGARGVGKTSAARILAKALNCLHGPTPVPCNKCEICRSINSGDDVDVLEIDGASNRGIDEIRQLRQNVNVRPSRTRLKIYIIDEVHMLTREAFNALLKTLEEPPEHVKFIFCTTEPAKIPITILSRCQRFDFAGIRTESIVRRLRQIVDSEKLEADDEALGLLARRATGSMRDAQSLLEQLLAFSSEKITVDHVHSMLGTAGDQRLARLIDCLVRRQPAEALAELDAAAGEGVDLALLVEQILYYLRDCMAASLGCSPDTFLYASPTGGPRVAETGKRLGLQTVLAAMQILDHTLARLRFSTQTRTLTELALVRICSLEDLDDLAALIASLGSGPPGPPASPPNARRASPPAARPSAPARPARRPPSTEQAAQPHRPPAAAPPSAPTARLTEANAQAVWSQVLAGMSDVAADHARQFERVALEQPNRLVVTFASGYTLSKSFCERPQQLARFEQALAQATGRKIKLEFAVSQQEPQAHESPRPVPVVSPHQRLMEVAKHPMIRKAGELFGATPTEVIEPPKTKQST